MYFICTLTFLVFQFYTYFPHFFPFFVSFLGPFFLLMKENDANNMHTTTNDREAVSATDSSILNLLPGIAHRGSNAILRSRAWYS